PKPAPARGTALLSDAAPLRSVPARRGLVVIGLALVVLVVALVGLVSMVVVANNLGTLGTGPSQISSPQASSPQTSRLNAASSGGVVNPSDKKGGVLKLAHSVDADSLDPARAYHAWVWNMQRFYIRTLVTPQGKPGKDGLKLVNDLASSQDISSDGLT